MEDLKKLREKIDKIDASLIKKLAQRQKISKKIRLIKINAKIKVRDPSREKKQQQEYERLCFIHQIDSGFIKKIFGLILANSRSLQRKNPRI